MWNSYNFGVDVDAEAWGVDARLLSSDTSGLESSSCSSLLWSLYAASSSSTIFGASTFPVVLRYNIIYSHFHSIPNVLKLPSVFDEVF